MGRGGRYDFDFVVTFYWQPVAAAFDSKPKRERQREREREIERKLPELPWHAMPTHFTAERCNGPATAGYHYNFMLG